MKPTWYIDPRILLELSGFDDEEDLLEYLKDMRRQVDEEYPRRKDGQTSKILGWGFGCWSALHWAMFSLSRDLEGP